MEDPRYPDEKSSSVEAIQAKREAMAQAGGRTALSDHLSFASRLSHLRALPHLPDCSFMERRQAQLDAEQGPSEAA